MQINAKSAVQQAHSNTRPSFSLRTASTRTRKHRSVSKHACYQRAHTQQITTVHVESFFRCGNDPSAGSPTETLLRLHLPLNGEVKKSSHKPTRNKANRLTVPIFHRVIQSVGATGGVYKGQGRNQCKLMTCVY